MKFFKGIYKIVSLMLLKVGIYKVNVSSENKLITPNQEWRVFKDRKNFLHQQLPDIVTDTYRYAVTYVLNVYKDTTTTTKTCFKVFSKHNVTESYRLELKMYGEPVSVTFTVDNNEDNPICVHNTPENKSVRLYKRENENLYSDTFKMPNTDLYDANSRWLNNPVRITAKTLYLDWNKIRYKCGSQRIVDVQNWDQLEMISEIMIESCLRSLKEGLQREMRSGKLMQIFTNGEIQKNMLIIYEVESE